MYTHINVVANSILSASLPSSLNTHSSAICADVADDAALVQSLLSEVELNNSGQPAKKKKKKKKGGDGKNANAQQQQKNTKDDHEHIDVRNYALLIFRLLVSVIYVLHV